MTGVLYVNDSRLDAELAPTAAEAEAEVLLRTSVLLLAPFALLSAGVFRVDGRGSSCRGVFRDDDRADSSVFGVLLLDFRAGKAAPPKLKLKVAFFISRGLSIC